MVLKDNIPFFWGAMYDLSLFDFENTNDLISPDNTSLAAKGAFAHRLQRRTARKIQNGRQGVPKWRMGSGKVPTPMFLGVLSNFR